MKGASIFAREPANYRGLARGLGEQGEKDIYFRGRGEQRPSFEGNKGTKTIVGNREHKKSTKEGKDQESIQLSTTPDPGYQWESNKLTIGQISDFLRNRGGGGGGQANLFQGNKLTGTPPFVCLQS